MVLQARIASRLDHRNAVLHGITDNLLERLQSIQNAAARLVTRTGQFELIAPVLRELHWLPVRVVEDYEQFKKLLKHICSH